VKNTLERTIQIHGPREWHKISETVLASSGSDPETIPSLSEFKSRAHTDLLKIKQYSARWNPGSALGFLMSFPIPQFDIEFQQRGTREKSLFFHKPFVALGLISTRWWIRMLELTLEQSHPSLRESRNLNRLLGFLREFELGFSNGVYRKDLAIKFFLALRKQNQFFKLRLEVTPQLLRWLSLQMGFKAQD